VAREVPMRTETAAERRAAVPLRVASGATVDGAKALDADDLDVDRDASSETFVAPAPREAQPTPGRIIVTLPFTPDSAAEPVRAARAVPSVRGLTVREAARTLFAAGFRVTLRDGVPGRTRPAAGTAARAGSVVVLEVDR
jgi:hypothetical protein